MVKGELPTCLGEESGALRNSLITHTSLNPGLTVTEIFCLLYYTSPHMFLQWMGLKCLFITLEIVLYGHWAYEDSRSHAAQHRWFQVLYDTHRKAANPPSHTTRSGSLMTSPFLLPADRSSTNCAEPRGGGKGISHDSFCCPIKHKRCHQQEALELHSNFGVELQQCGHSFWL